MLHEKSHHVVLVKLLGQCGPRWRELAGDRRRSRASVCYGSRRVSCQAARRALKKRAGSEPDRSAPAPRCVIKVAGFPARRRHAMRQKMREFRARSRARVGGPAPRCVAKVAGFPARRHALRQKNARFRGRAPRRLRDCANRWTPRHGHNRANRSQPRQPVTTAPTGHWTPQHDHKKSATGNPLRFELAEEVKPRHPRPRPRRHGETTAEH